MRQFFLAIFMLLSTSPAWCADLYRAVLHVVSSNGKYQQSILKDTADGVPRVKCDLRRENWLKEFGPALDAAEKQSRNSGSKPSSYRLECERISK